MSKIADTLTLFDSGKISKHEFIQEMYERHHSKLFDYTTHLPKTNIQKIEILDREILCTTRDRGVKMFCIPGDFRIAPIETLNFFDYEKDDAAMMERLIGDNDTVLDVGANIGVYSINLGLARRNAQIHCFEPIPETFNYLKRNINENACTNVMAYNFGLSDCEGEFDFYFYGEGSGNASSADLSGRKDVQTIKCAVQTLDEFTTKRNIAVDFIKCDVEGAELLVFKGALNTIQRDLPIVFAEVLRKWSGKFGYNPNDIFEFFKTMHYECFTVHGSHLKQFHTMDDSTISTNFFFLHSKKHALQIRRTAQP